MAKKNKPLKSPRLGLSPEAGALPNIFSPCSDGVPKSSGGNCRDLHALYSVSASPGTRRVQQDARNGIDDSVCGMDHGDCSDPSIETGARIKD